MSISTSKQSLQIAKRNHSNFYEISVISFRIEILRRSYAPSTLLYTPNVLHVDFSVETIPANRKTQSFKFLEISVISFRIEVLRHLNALSTSFYTPNVLHVDISVETIPANRKTQSIKFLRNLCHFVPYCDITALIRSFHSIIHAECSACRFQCQKNPCKSQNAIYQISTKSVSFSFRNEILRRSYALSTLFYTSNVLHLDFCVETIPANRKTQSFKLQRYFCHFVLD
jgi:hypothetical protein